MQLRTGVTAITGLLPDLLVLVAILLHLHVLRSQVYFLLREKASAFIAGAHVRDQSKAWLWRARRAMDDVNGAKARERDEEKMGDDSEGSKSAAPRTPTITAETAALFDFAKTPDLAGRWRSLNDGVMGGVSDGVMRMRMSDLGESHATFEGTVRLENNGGFSSVRTSFGSGIDLSQFSGFYLDVRPGDDASAGSRRQLL